MVCAKRKAMMVQLPWPAIATMLVMVAGGLLLFGCRGIPTQSEEQAREKLRDVTAKYRPGGQKPSLPQLTPESGLSNYLAYAMFSQPKVEAAYFDWAASIERITSARGRPDPQITFQTDIMDVVSSIMPGLMMYFPAPGKLRAGAEVASAESQARYFAFQSAVLESAFEVKRAYYQLYFLEGKLRVNRQTLELLSNLERLARTQNEVGKGTLQDVLRAQIEQDRVKTELANLEDSRAVLAARFKAALGLPSEAPGPPVPQRFESTPIELSAARWFEVGRSNSTRLRALEAEVQAARAAILLAGKARLPESSLGIMADVKMNPTLYRPQASVSLPIWRDKIAAQVAEAQAAQHAAEARVSAEAINLAVDFAQREYICREADRNLELLREQLLPKARQSLEAARSGYLSGQIDFFNLMDAQRTLLGFELDEIESATQRELALAELSLVLQGMPPANPTMGTSSNSMSRSSPASAQKAKGGM